MRLWREQAYPAQTIHVPRKVARAKASLSIPQDPWQSFPDGEVVAVDMSEFSSGSSAVGMMEQMKGQLRSGRVCYNYRPCWTGSYAMDDWQRVVAYLEGRTAHLEQAIGACIR